MKNTKLITVIFTKKLKTLDKVFLMIFMGAFHSTKNSGNSGMGSEWNESKQQEKTIRFNDSFSGPVSPNRN